MKTFEQDIFDQLPVAVIDQIVRQQEEIDRLRELLREARDELEYWTPDETKATADESEALNGYYALRDSIDATLGGEGK